MDKEQLISDVEERLRKVASRALLPNSKSPDAETVRRMMEDSLREMPLLSPADVKVILHAETEDDRIIREVLEDPMDEVRLSAQICLPVPLQYITMTLVVGEPMAACLEEPPSL
jgi:hypothetical protein